MTETCDTDAAHSAIKFKRMKEKFGTVSGGKATPSKKDAMADDGDGEETPKKKRAPRATPGKKGSAKKRKMEQDDGDETPEENTVKEEVVEEVSIVEKLLILGKLY